MQTFHCWLYISSCAGVLCVTQAWGKVLCAFTNRANISLSKIKGWPGFITVNMFCFNVCLPLSLFSMAILVGQ